MQSRFLIMAIAVVIVMIGVFLFLFLSSDPESTDYYYDYYDEFDEGIPPPPGAIVAEPRITGESPEWDLYGSAGENLSELQPATGVHGLELFAETLFIGDSIFTGIDGYGFLPAENVFARVGMSTSSAKTALINGRTLFGEIGIITEFNQVVIMIGDNELDGTNAAESAAELVSLIDEIKFVHSGIKVVVLTVPPVLRENEYDLSNDMIKGYNSALNALAGGKDIVIIDYNSALRDSDGYLNPQYAQPDGVHLRQSAYEIMFNMLE